MTDHSIAEFLHNRRSVLAAKLVEPGPDTETLNAIIRIGLRVPDHSRCGPWRIQVIGKEGQAKLGELYATIFDKENDDASKSQIEYWRGRPQVAPVLLAITCYPNQEKMHKIPLWEQVLSGGALCQNILNGAHAFGFAAQWLTEWPAYHADVRKFLGHEPETEVYGFIFIGTASEAPKERKRIGADEVVSVWPA